MTLDVYSYCSCGSGKKLKFCCCKDILNDMEKIQRAMEGEQRAAARDLIQRAIAVHGNRPGLLALLAEANLDEEGFATAEQCVTQLLAAVPHSNSGLAMRAILDVQNDQLDAAVKHLQEALENSDEFLHQMVYVAVGVVALGLLKGGKIAAARAHLEMQAAIEGPEAARDQSLRSLQGLLQLPQIPVLLKQNYDLVECPPDAPWHGEFSAALKSAGSGTWQAACESLESLNQKVADQSCIWRNIAILRMWLGRNAQATEAWRKYAQLPDVSGEEAVEAEAVAHLLTPSTDDEIDEVALTYEVPEIDPLMELLLSDRRAVAVPDSEFADLVPEGEPRPRGAFTLFDGPIPPSLDEITSVTQLPLMIGLAAVFGRQTDRPARVELTLLRDDQFDQNRQTILDWWSGRVGGLLSEQVTGSRPRDQSVVSVTRGFPKTTDVARFRELMKEHRREAFLCRWADVPQRLFDGKNVRQAAADPALRNRATAAILNLEMSNEELGADDTLDFNELRRELGLPERGVTQLNGKSIEDISLVQLGRVDFSKLANEELAVAFARLSAVGYKSAQFRCGLQILERPALMNAVSRSDLWHMLAGLAPNSDEALRCLERGRQEAVAAGGSPAPWYLEELRLRLGRMEFPEANRLIQLIATRHANEPGIGNALIRILAEFGVVNPDGTPVGGAAARPEAGGGSVPEPAAAPAGGLWTPDSAAQEPKRESKLWLPGT